MLLSRKIVFEIATTTDAWEFAGLTEVFRVQFFEVRISYVLCWTLQFRAFLSSTLEESRSYKLPLFSTRVVFTADVSELICQALTGLRVDAHSELWKAAPVPGDRHIWPSVIILIIVITIIGADELPFAIFLPAQFVIIGRSQSVHMLASTRLFLKLDYATHAVCRHSQGSTFYIAKTNRCFSFFSSRSSHAAHEKWSIVSKLALVFNQSDDWKPLFQFILFVCLFYCWLEMAAHGSLHFIVWMKR